MQTRLTSDRPPLTIQEAIPVGTGRLFGTVTGDGCRWHLLAGHCQLNSNQPALSIDLDADACDKWTGELNAEMAIFTEKFSADGVDFVRETIAHMDMDLLIVRMMASHPFSATVKLAGEATALASNGKIVMAGADGDQRFTAEARVHLGGGEMATEGNEIFVRDAYELVLELNIGVGTGTEAAAECGRHRIAGVDGWDQLMQKHVDAWRQHFGGLTGTISGSDNAEPLPSRIDSYASGKSDPRLLFAYLQLCRHLICSRHATATCSAKSAEATIDQTGIWTSLHATSLPGYFAPIAAEIGDLLHARQDDSSQLPEAVIASFIGDDLTIHESIPKDRQALHKKLIERLQATAESSDTALVATALLAPAVQPPARQLTIGPCALAAADRLPAPWRKAVAEASVTASSPATQLAAAAWQAALRGDAEQAFANLSETIVRHTAGYLTPISGDTTDLAAAALSAGAIVALLIQSDDADIHLLPALPSAWPQGAVHGLRLRGGWSISLEWSLGRVNKAVIAGSRGGRCVLRNLPDAYKLVDDHENTVPFTQEGDVFTFEPAPMHAYFLERTKLI